MQDKSKSHISYQKASTKLSPNLSEYQIYLKWSKDYWISSTRTGGEPLPRLTCNDNATTKHNNSWNDKANYVPASPSKGSFRLRWFWRGIIVANILEERWRTFRVIMKMSIITKSREKKTGSYWIIGNGDFPVEMLENRCIAQRSIVDTPLYFVT